MKALAEKQKFINKHIEKLATYINGVKDGDIVDGCVLSSYRIDTAEIGIDLINNYSYEAWNSHNRITTAIQNGALKKAGATVRVISNPVITGKFISEFTVFLNRR